MLQIVLIRPGSTDFDQQGRIQGTLDIPLCEQGMSEVDRVSEELRTHGLSVVYASPCQSSWQTATLLAERLGVKAKKLDNMRNLDHGLWQGLLIEDVKRKQPKVYRQWQDQPEIICPPEGEMVAQAQERVQASLVKLLKKHKKGAIGVVAPEPLASLAHSFLTGKELGDLWKSDCPCGRWELIPVETSALSYRGVEIG